MDNEFVDLQIDADEPKLESQESQQSQEAVYPTLPPITIEQPSSLHKISFHLTEQVSSSITQYYENISYVVHSQIDDGPSGQVFRKYTHFEWLQAALKREMPGLLIPAIPPKSVLAKINLADHTTQIREKRYRQLIEFLFKVCSHPKMQQSKKLEIFLAGSNEQLQQELSELSNSLASYMGSAIINVGSKAFDIAKGSFSYLSSFIYAPQPQQQLLYPEQENAQDIKELFESWEDVHFITKQLLFEEQQKIKKICEEFTSIVNLKMEQNEEMKRIISTMQQLAQLDKGIKKTQASVYLNESILNEIKMNVLFKMELIILDIDEALSIIRRRQELIAQIQQQIKLHNQNESFNGNDICDIEKLTLKDQIRENQRALRLLESNFQNDIKEFTKQLNDYVGGLIGSYNELFQKLYVEQKRNWCE